MGNGSDDEQPQPGTGRVDPPGANVSGAAAGSGAEGGNYAGVGSGAAAGSVSGAGVGSVSDAEAGKGRGVEAGKGRGGLQAADPCCQQLRLLLTQQQAQGATGRG